MNVHIASVCGTAGCRVAARGALTVLVVALAACGSSNQTDEPKVPEVGSWQLLSTETIGTNRTAWNGAELFVWGTGATEGGVYSLSRNEWTPATSEGSPFGKDGYLGGVVGQSLLWIDENRVLFWSGTGCGRAHTESCSDGFIYDVPSNTWTKLATQSPLIARDSHSTVWTGDKMIVWGGINRTTMPDSSTRFEVLADGAIYDPAHDSWSLISKEGAPVRRSTHTAVWTGSKMIVWGGWEQTWGMPIFPEDGGVYDPATDTWMTMTRLGAPTARQNHTAIWTGTEMIVWGGTSLSKETSRFSSRQDGAAYDPVLDRWRTISDDGAPSARLQHSAVWTGEKMIIWGGRAGGERNTFSNGAIYDVRTDTWQPTATLGAPHPRTNHSAYWTGSQMLIWGGDNGREQGFYGDGALFMP